MNNLRTREHSASILVAALTSAFGVLLLSVTGSLEVLIRASFGSDSGVLHVLLTLVALIFIVIAVYVSSVVTANTFATIIAGRRRTIALLRLIGSSATAQRRAVAREGFVVGVAGAALGVVIGTVIALLIVRVAVSTGGLPDLDYPLFPPLAILPILGVVLSTWAASWAGSKRVLTVTPIEATGAAQEESREATLAHRGRHVVAILLMVVGFGLLGLGVLVGLVTPLGVLIGMVGGLISFTGLVLGAQLIMPPALRLVGRMLGSTAPARLAAANAVRYPERSSRTTIGLVIGVTLITMFTVASESFLSRMMSLASEDPENAQSVNQLVTVIVSTFSVLIGFSALIAIVGVINNLSLSVLQRNRELGLLRALGFTASQVRWMIVAESAQITVTAVGVGLVLGIFYGWAGAQSLLGSVQGMGVVPPTIPWPLLAGAVIVSALVTVAASVTPARRATRVSPVAALVVA